MLPKIKRWYSMSSEEIFDDSDDNENVVEELENRHLEKKRRRVWSQAPHQREDILKDLHENEDNDHINYMPMNKETYDELLSKVTPFIQKQNTIMREAIPARTRLNITLQFLAKGNNFEEMKYDFNVSAQLIGKIVVEVCESLIKVLKEFVKTPSTSGEWQKVAEDFYSKTGFPNCLGFIESKHIKIKKPAFSGIYYNYNQTHSIVLTALLNAHCQFLAIEAAQYGRNFDEGFFLNSSLERHLLSRHIPDPIEVLPGKELPYTFIGYNATPLRSILMIPYSGKSLTKDQKIFNRKLRSIHVEVENVFGVLAKRFQILTKTINLCPEKALKIVMSCCYLYNYIKIKDNDLKDLPPSALNTGNMKLIPMEPIIFKDSNTTAEEARNEFCKILKLLHKNKTPSHQ